MSVIDLIKNAIEKLTEETSRSNNQLITLKFSVAQNERDEI